MQDAKIEKLKNTEIEIEKNCKVKIVIILKTINNLPLFTYIILKCRVFNTTFSLYFYFEFFDFIFIFFDFSNSVFF